MATIDGWSVKAPGLVGWVEANIYESPRFRPFPEARPKHKEAPNMVEPSNEEIKRRPPWCGSSPTRKALTG
ncbi:MAG: hypothetical protein M0Z91_13175 [Actinomycetota bacterium]|nr:hypothetical protein [Actinomycetota bacterium]